MHVLESTLGEGIAIPTQFGHDISPVIVRRLHMVNNCHEDVLVGLCIPILHSSFACHAVAERLVVGGGRCRYVEIEVLLIDGAIMLNKRSSRFTRMGRREEDSSRDFSRNGMMKTWRPAYVS